MSPDFLRAMRASRSGNNILGHCLRGSANKVETCGVSVWSVVFALFSIILMVGLWRHLFILGTKDDSVGAFMTRQDSAPCSAQRPCSFSIVADLDDASRQTGPNGKTSYKSLLTVGLLSSENPPLGKYSVAWRDTTELMGLYNEGGRGMELSELVTFNGKLLSFDDRTGIVYEISSDRRVIPRYVLTEGNGNNAKGMKVEWATEKDGELWVGSFGKEFTTTDGQTIVGENNFWVATISPNGAVKYRDWKPFYNKIRDVLGVPFPGYVLHEAVNWNPSRQEWVFLPRRVSAENYEEVADEMRGSNKVIMCNEDFSELRVRSIGEIIPERGFSSFKFVPGTQGEVVAALKSVEESKTGKQKTFLTVFTLGGTILMSDTEVPQPYKYEGIEFST